MNQSIYKFELSLHGSQILMPKGARVLSAQNQNERLQIWALVDPTLPQDQIREFLVLTTGQPCYESMNEGWDFLGTVQLRGGVLVLHVFVKLAFSSDEVL